MAWLEIHQELPDHPKTVKAARLLDIQRTSVVGHMVTLWLWALDHAQDGDLSGYDVEEIADGAGWHGTPQQFVDALLGCGRQGKAGFLEEIDGRLVIHDWYEYAGKLINSRLRDAERKRAGRSKDVHGTSGGHPADIRRTAAAVQRNTTLHYTTESGGLGATPPELDPDWAKALQAFEASIGKVGSGFTLQEMQQVFDEMRGAGRADWWQKAIDETCRLQGNSWTYMSKIIEGAVKRDTPPGERQPAKTNGPSRPQGRDLNQLLGLDKDGNYIGNSARA